MLNGARLCFLFIFPLTQIISACAQSTIETSDRSEVIIALETPPENQTTKQALEIKQTLEVKQGPTILPVSEGQTSEIKIAQVGPAFKCTGIAKQGGLVVCQTQPYARVKIARSEDDFYFEKANGQGRLIVGFDRDEKTTILESAGERLEFNLTARDYDTSRISGLPKNMVSEYTPEELKRIRAASALKKKGFASRVSEVGFKDGFIYPIQEDYIKTTNFGAQRILNDIPKKPHYGVDLAAPKGTPIVAPADGIISLANDDMYFEGSLILIDHGQGLISYYLHNDTVLVKDGEAVAQGQQIATVGTKGRSTGPHLCWRLKWRNRNLDPELLTEWPHDH